MARELSQPDYRRAGNKPREFVASRVSVERPL